MKALLCRARLLAIVPGLMCGVLVLKQPAPAQAGKEPQAEAAPTATAEPTYEGKPLTHWVRALEDKDKGARRRAAQALIAIGEPAYPALAKALSNPREDVWRFTVESMVDIGPAAAPAMLAVIRLEESWELRHNGGLAALTQMGPAAFPALREALRDEDKMVRMSAIAAFRVQGLTGEVDEVSVAALAAVLGEDPEPVVRAGAAGALGSTGAWRAPPPEEAVAALVEALRDESERVRVEAAGALALRGALSHKPMPEAKAGLPVLIEGLRSRDEEIRWEAASALSSLGPEAEAAIPALAEALEDPQVSGQAAEALAAIGDAAVPALVEAPESESVEARTNAADALARLGLSGHVSCDRALADLKDEDPEVREAAAFALANAVPDDRRVVPALIEALGDSDRRVRERAAYALGNYGPEARDAVPKLMSMLSDDAITMMAAATALGAIGPAAEPAIPALRAVLSREPYPGAAKALARIGGAALPALVSALKDENEGARADAALALGYLGPEAGSAVPDLVAALGDEHERVRNGAAKALGEMGPAAEVAVPELIATLRDPDADVRAWAADALGRIGGEARAAIPELSSVLAEGEPEENTEAIIALFRLGAGGLSVPALVRVASNKGGFFRLQACSLLAKLGPEAKGAEGGLSEIMNDETEGESVRLASAYALARIDAASAAPVAFLEAALSDDDERIRVAAGAGLAEARRAGADVQAALRPLLKPGGGVLAVDAARVLAQVDPQDASATAFLANAMSDKHKAVRRSAAIALAELGHVGNDVVAALFAPIGEDERPVVPFLRGLQALGKAGPAAKDAASRLAGFANSEEIELRSAARTALAKIRGELPAAYEDPARTETLFFRLLTRGPMQLMIGWF